MREHHYLALVVTLMLAALTPLAAGAETASNPFAAGGSVDITTSAVAGQSSFVYYAYDYCNPDQPYNTNDDYQGAEQTDAAFSGPGLATASGGAWEYFYIYRGKAYHATATFPSLQAQGQLYFYDGTAANDFNDATYEAYGYFMGNVHCSADGTTATINGIWNGDYIATYPSHSDYRDWHASGRMTATIDFANETITSHYTAGRSSVGTRGSCRADSNVIIGLYYYDYC
jgi:hypothetical protein